MNLSATFPPPAESRPGRVRLAAAGIVATVVLAYQNSFAVPFLFDDLPSILGNEAVRNLPAWADAFFSGLDGGLTTGGRPVFTLTLVVNHVLGGDRVAGYHAVNLAIHAAAALGLFGLVRRTLLLPALRVRFGVASLPLAAATAVLWALHPLPTAAVTYLVQRAESLAALLVLLTLYTFVRAVGATDGAGRRWYRASVGACLLAMGTKETAVVAPVLVLLFDRTWVGGSFRQAWRERRTYYLALGATWCLLLWLVVGAAGRGGTAGFTAGLPVWSYALTQCRAIAGYLGLAVWPYPLVFDYGLDTARQVGAVLPQALLVLGLMGATAVALVRRPALGWLGATFLLLLAPSSSFIPIVTQTAAEHRMYLPLAVPVVLAVLGAHRVLGARLTAWVGLTAAAMLVATRARNHDYRSELAIWADAAAKHPANARAHNNLGQAWFRSGDVARAVACYERALALQPLYPETHYNLAVARAQLGSLPEAIAGYEEALRLRPDYPEAHNNLANALVRTGRRPEALLHYEAALRFNPHFAEAHGNLGNALLEEGRTEEAIGQFRRALALRPDQAEAHYHLGNALAAAQRLSEALGCYQAAVRLRPGFGGAHVNAGNALLQLGRPSEAIASYERALALNPGLAAAQFNLASALLTMERWTEAIPHLEQAVRLDPGARDSRRALGFALARVGRPQEAVVYYQSVLREEPDDVATRQALAELQGPPAR